MILADDLLRIAAAEVGVHEIPDGSNRGPRVCQYQNVCTPGYCGYAWCVAFVQWVLVSAGIGTIANRTAGVYALLDYARKRNWDRGLPREGDLVCFIEGAGHIGIVSGVAADKHTFYTIEGNASNSVTRRVHTRSEPVAFVRVPGVAIRTKKVYYWVPRFEVVTSVNGHARTLMRWGKWAKIGPRLPGLLKRYHQVRLKRKVVKTWKRVPVG